ncbi:hypothetical protein ACFL26_02160 [Patescibacteria group bacterium]
MNFLEYAKEFLIPMAQEAGRNVDWGPARDQWGKPTGYQFLRFRAPDNTYQLVMYEKDGVCHRVELYVAGTEPQVTDNPTNEDLRDLIF